MASFFIHELIFLILCFTCSQGTNSEAQSRQNIPCTYDEDCLHVEGMICKNQGCVCGRFSSWDEKSKICLFDYAQLREFLTNLTEQEERNHKGEQEKRDESSFYLLGLAGLTAVVLVFVGAMTCVLFFCIINSLQDSNKTLSSNTCCTNISKPGRGEDSELINA